MPLLREIVAFLRQLAPEETAMKGDPVGLSISFGEDVPVRTLGVCLDVTPEGAAAAAGEGAELIVAHHPLLFDPIKIIHPETDGIARTVVTLVNARIAFYGCHTNWDRAKGGINDTLAGLLGLVNVRVLGNEGDADIARVGELAEAVPLPEFREAVRKALRCSGENALRGGDRFDDRIVRRVAVCGGAGAGFIKDAIAAKADVFVTSDIKHHEFLNAAALGLPILDAGHSATESPGMRTLSAKLSDRFPDLKILWLD